MLYEMWQNVTLKSLSYVHQKQNENKIKNHLVWFKRNIGIESIDSINLINTV